MNEKKRQDLPAKIPSGLWVIATPIGNLADLTPRAREALAEADAVLCEDTRRTGELFHALGLKPRELHRFDAYAGEGKMERALERLKGGESLALVTDAGTPAVSDPGAALVARAHAENVRVTPIPGASAASVLLSAAGFEETAYCFLGFFPRKSAEREEQLDAAIKSQICRVFLWFESPQRIVSALEDVAAFAPQARLAAAKELTKLHEKIFTGEARDVAAQVREEIAREGERGEWSFGVCFEKTSASEAGDVDSSDWVKALRCLLDARVSASEAARQVSQHFGAPKKIVYDQALKLSGKKSTAGG